ncbi:hypothetical protein JMN32_09430 [Fulvivirga sp. 29W222]|uniref:3-hydroxyacyl-ACP dehydratase n=1 Tax=Fulvivirga marina TaxID=2494733 RepID=A0A937FUT0_9BACT|nr:hypothetical protein [Fulvivirga marina]MBL6446530.1 hypothetical protein [Fulvivirga marina]
MTVLEEGNELLKYIPQRHPFVMVSSLHSHGEKSVVSGLKVSNDNLLVNEGQLQEAGLVENMAQTAALFAGIQAHLSRKEAPVGFIASVKGLKIHKLPLVGDNINTSVEIVNEVMNMQIAMARVYDESENTIAECELRIFIKPEEDQD